MLGLPYSVSKKGGECTGTLLLIPFITELTLQKDSCVCVCVFSHSSVSDSAILWTIAHQAPLSMRLSRQDDLVGGGGCHFPLQGIFPDQGSNPYLLHWQVNSLPLGQLGSLYVAMDLSKPWEAVKGRQAWHVAVCGSTGSWTRVTYTPLLEHARCNMCS